MLNTRTTHTHTLDQSVIVPIYRLNKGYEQPAVDLKANQLVNQLVNRSINQSVSQSAINQSINQSVSQSINQSVTVTVTVTISPLTL